MRAVFADTSYYGALLSPKDALHEQAVRWMRTSNRPTLLTEFVLLELGNGFHLLKDRVFFLDFVEELRSDPDAMLIPASSDLLRAGLEFYGKRLDKEWSLTDCISFVVMQEHGLTEALTGITTSFRPVSRLCSPRSGMGFPVKLRDAPRREFA
jgi:predicted nucleic acid-binding protein